MKPNSLLFIALITLGLTSCVQRLDLPQDIDLKMMVELELVKGDEITAKVSVSSELNGFYDIKNPENADIQLVKNDEEIVGMQYDADRRIYFANVNSVSFITSNATLKLEASLANEGVDNVTSSTKVPFANDVSLASLIAEEFVEIEDEQYWQGTFHMELGEGSSSVGNFYRVKFDVKLTIDDNGTLRTEGDWTEMEIVNVENNLESLNTFSHLEGLYIEFDKMDEDFFEITLRSNIPHTEDNRVYELLRPEITSVSEDHFNYHRGIDNINRNNSSIFNEPALYRTNIKNGLGVFSSSVSTNK